MKVAYQTIHDALQELITAASHVHETIEADFPEVCTRICEFILERKYTQDPLSRLYVALERATAVARDMERL